MGTRLKVKFGNTYFTFTFKKNGLYDIFREDKNIDRGTYTFSMPYKDSFFYHLNNKILYVHFDKKLVSNSFEPNENYFGELIDMESLV